MGTRAVEPGLGDEHALAPGLDPTVGGLEQHREVAGQELGLRPEHGAEAVELVAHLFALVEREGDVVMRRDALREGRRASSSARRSSTASTTLHVGRAEPVQHVTLDARHLVAGDRGHGVEVAAEHDAPVAPELRAHDDVVLDAVDGERRRRGSRRRASTRSASSASWWLSDGTADQRGGELEQVLGVDLEHPRRRGLRHVAAPWSRRMSLSLLLS